MNRDIRRERAIRSRIKEKAKMRQEDSQKSPSVHGGMNILSMLGNQQVQRLFQAGEIMAKLNLSQPGDLLERVADRIADRVVGGTGPISERIDQYLAGSAARATGSGNEHITPGTESRILGLSGGKPLPASERSFYENRMGSDFSRVRVHTGPTADELARSINARAFTYNNNVVFAKDQYAPGTTRGRHLMAHELTHVMQQGHGVHNLVGPKNVFLKSNTDLSPAQQRAIAAVNEWEGLSRRKSAMVNQWIAANYTYYFSKTNSNPYMSLWTLVNSPVVMREIVRTEALVPLQMGLEQEKKNAFPNQDQSTSVWASAPGTAATEALSQVLSHTVETQVLERLMGRAVQGAVSAFLCSTVIGIIVAVGLNLVIELISREIGNNEQAAALRRTNENWYQFITGLLIPEMGRSFESAVGKIDILTDGIKNDIENRRGNDPELALIEQKYAAENNVLRNFAMDSRGNPLTLAKALMKEWVLNTAGEHNNADRFTTNDQWEHALEEVQAVESSFSMENRRDLFLRQYENHLRMIGIAPERYRSEMAQLKLRVISSWQQGRDADSLCDSINERNPLTKQHFSTGFWADREFDGVEFGRSDIVDVERFMDNMNAIHDIFGSYSNDGAVTMRNSRNRFRFGIGFDVQERRGTVYIDDFYYYIELENYQRYDTQLNMIDSYDRLHSGSTSTYKRDPIGGPITLKVTMKCSID